MRIISISLLSMLVIAAGCTYADLDKIAVLDNCSKLGGVPCTTNQYCKDGVFQSSSDAGAYCCVGGICTTPGTAPTENDTQEPENVTQVCGANDGICPAGCSKHNDVDCCDNYGWYWYENDCHSPPLNLTNKTPEGSIPYTVYDANCVCDGNGCSGILDTVVSGSHATNIFEDDGKYVTMSHFSLGAGCSQWPTERYCPDNETVEQLCGSEGLCYDGCCQPKAPYCRSPDNRGALGWMRLELETPAILSAIEIEAKYAGGTEHTNIGFSLLLSNGTWVYAGNTGDLSTSLKKYSVSVPYDIPVSQIHVESSSWQVASRNVVDYIHLIPAGANETPACGADDGTCPAGCSKHDDADCCADYGWHWYEGGCHSEPYNVTNETYICGEADQVCPTDCSKHNDVDCCNNYGWYWYDMECHSSPYVPPSNQTIFLAGYWMEDTVLLNWTAYTGGDFLYYKVVRSTTNPEPVYPDDGYIAVVQNASWPLYSDEDVPNGTVYYRITTVLTDYDTKIHSNVVNITP